MWRVRGGGEGEGGGDAVGVTVEAVIVGVNG